MPEVYGIKSYEHALTFSDNSCFEKKDLIIKAKAGIEEYIFKIYDPGIRNFTVEALSEGPMQFWLAPCSSSGKYHPPEDQDVGGVIRHTIKAAEIALEGARPFCLSKEETDYALAATILHDLQKDGIPWTGKTDYRHGKIASEWLQQFPLDNGKKEICNAVRYHMWKWAAVKTDSELEEILSNNKEDIKKQKEEIQKFIAANMEDITRGLNPTPIELVVQLADYNSSRKGVSFMPGIDVIDHPLFIERYGNVKRDDK